MGEFSYYSLNTTENTDLKQYFLINKKPGNDNVTWSID